MATNEKEKKEERRQGFSCKKFSISFNFGHSYKKYVWFFEVIYVNLHKM